MTPQPPPLSLFFYVLPIYMTNEGWLVNEMFYITERPTAASVEEMCREEEDYLARQGWAPVSSGLGDVSERTYSNLRMLIGTDPAVLESTVEEINRQIREAWGNGDYSFNPLQPKQKEAAA